MHTYILKIHTFQTQVCLSKERHFKTPQTGDSFAFGKILTVRRQSSFQWLLAKQKMRISPRVSQMGEPFNKRRDGPVGHPILWGSWPGGVPALCQKKRNRVTYWLIMLLTSKQFDRQAVPGAILPPWLETSVCNERGLGVVINNIAKKDERIPNLRTGWESGRIFWWRGVSRAKILKHCWEKRAALPIYKI